MGGNGVATRRLYYEDSFLKEFTARVVYCEVLPPDVQGGIPGTAWGLMLDRTAFYPSSGGQPHDLGKIGDANVLEVREGRWKLQLRGEAFNILNWVNPSGFASANDTATNFGQINGFRAARRLQLAAKINF